MNTEKKKYMREYLKEWRKKNKSKVKKYNQKRSQNPSKYKENNKKYTKKYNLTNPEKRKITLAKYYKKKFNCIFCKKQHLIRNKKRHFNSKKHKKNIKKIEGLLQNFKFKPNF